MLFLLYTFSNYIIEYLCKFIWFVMGLLIFMRLLILEFILILFNLLQYLFILILFYLLMILTNFMCFLYLIPHFKKYL